MTIKELLEFTLIKTENFSINIYDVILVIIILIVTNGVIWVIKRLFDRQKIKKHLDVGRSHAIFQTLKYVIWLASISVILDTVGIKITFLLAGSAALLVGIGLGLQQIFHDILSGVVILFEGTVKVGDVVELENGIVGKVKQVGLRTSYIETRDNIIMIIPNSNFISNKVINWSHLEKKTRFHINVGVAYGSDVEKVKRVLLECANAHGEITKNPGPFVMFSDFGDSALLFKLHFWTNKSFFVEIIKSDLRFAIDKRFREEKVQIPFPQRDVHFYSEK